MRNTIFHTDDLESEYVRAPEIVSTSVADPCHFGMDPDPLIHASD